VDWSLGVEAFIYVCVATSVAWLLFDSPHQRNPANPRKHSSSADQT
jgi:hypothetical protein